MTGVPAPTLYHRWLGWHAPAMRRALMAFLAGLIVAVVLLPFVTWGLELVGGWDAAALTVLVTIWPVIARADSSLAPQLAAREDQTEGPARTLLVGASTASLLGAGYALHLAGRDSGAPRVLLIGFAVLTVVLSWTVINTVYTLRYADEHFRSKPGGIAFGTEDGQQHPSYRDFAYVAFTIGMCYQVSRHDTARPSDPAHRARSRHLVLHVRRGHRGGLSQPHLRAVPLTWPAPPRRWQVPGPRMCSGRPAGAEQAAAKPGKRGRTGSGLTYPPLADRRSAGSPAGCRPAGRCRPGKRRAGGGRCCAAGQRR
jgi:uncharacterized membrane protein